MAGLQQRGCLAGPCCALPKQLSVSSGLRFRRLRPECSSAAECCPSSPQPQPLVQRLAAAVQRVAAAVNQQRAAACDILSRHSSSSSSGAARQRLGGGLLLTAAAALPLPAGGCGVLSDLASNYVFVVGFCGWFMAQFLKIFTKRYKTGVWDARAFFDSGGMPSSHSALCSSVATAIAMQQGLGSPLFAVCVCFSVIVMYDAQGVRRHAGLQAQVLNVVAGEVFNEGHPASETKLKEVLGHTPRQVYAGLLLGVLVGLLLPVF